MRPNPSVERTPIGASPGSPIGDVYGLRRMPHTLRIEQVAHRSFEVARQLHSVQMRAYALEARLLGAVYFPPLERTVDDLRNSTETFLAARVEDQIVGAASTWPDDEGMGINIASLVVAPSHQRQGIGRKLMAAVLVRHGGEGLTVQTGVKNVPAITLYKSLGFAELRRWFVGREPLELVKLRRIA